MNKKILKYILLIILGIGVFAISPFFIFGFFVFGYLANDFYSDFINYIEKTRGESSRLFKAIFGLFLIVGTTALSWFVYFFIGSLMYPGGL